MTKKIITEIFAYILAALAVWCCIIFVKDESFVQREIISAIQRCLNIIIPSLFAFMALSGIIISSKIYKYICKPLYPISKYIFNMPNELFFVFLLGNVAGYPVGSKLLVQLVKENRITKSSAGILNCFCYNGGPAFYIGTIGLSVFGNSSVGIIIFLSIITANSVVAVILNRILKLKYIASDEKLSLTSDVLIDSVISAGKSMFVICTTIIFFSALMALAESNGLFNILSSLGLSENQCTLTKSIFEISYLSQLSGTPYAFIPYAAAICSFGGICVLTQIKAIVGKTYSLKYFFVARIFASALSFFTCKLIINHCQPEILTAVSTKAQIVTQPDNIVPSLCLVAMISIIFMHKKATCN